MPSADHILVGLLQELQREAPFAGDNHFKHADSWRIAAQDRLVLRLQPRDASREGVDGSQTLTGKPEARRIRASRSCYIVQPKARAVVSAKLSLPSRTKPLLARVCAIADRLGLEKMPDRFFEHPATVLAITNLNYADAPRLMLKDAQLASALNWQEVKLTGTSAHEYAEQIEELSATLNHGWQTRVSEKSGNPTYVRPTVLILYREDQKFLLNSVIPKPGRTFEDYDFILASQPWRARTSAQFKA